MAVAEICLFPLGTETPSVGKYLEPVMEEIRKSGLKYMVCPMGTVVEGEIDSILKLIKRCHEAIFKAGAKRVVISVKIDDRADKPITIESKLGI
ncbi:MTH1187 family thiamine-binding protein [Thermococcus sp. M39]|uniref:MTH1187 family thiamine-binding protein n=1 Tax=unclassified Thermococcus TaxID=2627626 RepID=UPI00143923F9|nr:MULTISPECIES: MTH1187 family thiamine-binding protein [unclassified Thermococcus]NJE08734.1 MTH1187 family thiamine-binding protein [Thermococcus sp. M39]NJE12965.1 MTH1187 family thiamine-binding protein [Thermococcus sp. LS2]